MCVCVCLSACARECVSERVCVGEGMCVGVHACRCESERENVSQSSINRKKRYNNKRGEQLEK